jgi:hypothetical protein
MGHAVSEKLPVARFRNAKSIGEMAMEPDLVVPALTNCLRSTGLYMRGAALDALGKFGANARS